MKNLLNIKAMVLTLFLSSLINTSAFASAKEKLMIECGNSCNEVANEIEKMGGIVNYKFKHTDMIAVTIDRSQRQEITKLDGVLRLQKDSKINLHFLKNEGEILDVSAEAVEPIYLDTNSNGFGLDLVGNADYTGFPTVHAQGIRGDGQIVAVMDTGVANSIGFSRLNCPTNQNEPTVIGGETFVSNASPNEPAATSFDNDVHGTVISHILAANVGILLPNSHPLTQAILQHAPWHLIIDSPFPGISTLKFIGGAPCAQIYAIKVVRSWGSEGPVNFNSFQSDVIAALERIIELKENFNNGVPSVPVSGTGDPDDPFVYDSLDIAAINMSFGSVNLYAGHSPIDDVLKKLLDLGVVSVASAGNEGHVASTSSTPGTGSASLNVGGFNPAAAERTFFDRYYPGTGIGSLLRPINNMLMWHNSSRGPSPDGKINTDIVASSAYGIVLTYNSLIFGSGTSGAAPQVTAAAVLLREAKPNATGNEIRSALLAGANPNLLDGSPEPIDQGYGVFNVAMAMIALENGAYIPLDKGTEGASVKGNFASVGYPAIEVGDSGYSTHISHLEAGQTKHIFLNSKRDTERFLVTISNVITHASQPNPYYGRDYIFIEAGDSKTGRFNPQFSGALGSGTSSYTFPILPDEGISRLSIAGHWRAVGPLSFDLHIEKETRELSPVTAKGSVMQNQSNFYHFYIPPGTLEAKFNLRWKNDWGAYPTDDLDLILVTPSGDDVYDAATWESPENATIESPEPGNWEVEVNGFTVWGIIGGNESKYELRVLLDGVPQ